MKLVVVLQPEEEGSYSVTCPAVPGAVSQGDTLSDALLNITEAETRQIEVRVPLPAGAETTAG